MGSALCTSQHLQALSHGSAKPGKILVRTRKLLREKCAIHHRVCENCAVATILPKQASEKDLLELFASLGFSLIVVLSGTVRIARLCRFFTNDCRTSSSAPFVAGAGGGALITKLNNQLHEELSKAKDSGIDVFEHHRALIETQLENFYRKYGRDLKKVGGLGLIVVAAPFAQKYVPAIYHTVDATLIPDNEYWAYGTGKPLSDYFADRLFRWDRMDKAIWLLWRVSS